MKLQPLTIASICKSRLGNAKRKSCIHSKLTLPKKEVVLLAKTPQEFCRFPIYYIKNIREHGALKSYKKLCNLDITSPIILLNRIIPK